ncbi:MAG: hypothetical protein ACOX8V_07960 [Thermoleophilia bacterium]|jgi:hypothetical protein
MHHKTSRYDPLNTITAASILSTRLAVPAFSADETKVLDALSRQHRLTTNQLMTATALDSDELRYVLGRLHMKGQVVRLQTVIESWCRTITALPTPDPQAGSRKLLKNEAPAAGTH